MWMKCDCADGARNDEDYDADWSDVSVDDDLWMYDL